jgi:hypothetical protein
LHTVSSPPHFLKRKPALKNHQKMEIGSKQEEELGITNNIHLPSRKSEN